MINDEHRMQSCAAFIANTFLQMLKLYTYNKANFCSFYAMLLILDRA